MAVNPVEHIDSRLVETRDRIAAAAARAGRDPQDVTLIAVTKGFGLDVIRAALDAGLLELGENRAQEFRQKVPVIGPGPRWHFIGHLQTNKAKHVVGKADLIHSVDRFGLGEAIAKRARALDLVQRVLVEVNVAGEARKHGVEPGKAVHLAGELAALPGLEVHGLMAMAPQGATEAELRSVFRDLRELGERLVVEQPGATQLSMGMSEDFEVAIEEGATMIRLGTALFGSRG